jgi:hypothetical protein
MKYDERPENGPASMLATICGIACSGVAEVAPGVCHPITNGWNDKFGANLWLLSAAD